MNAVRMVSTMSVSVKGGGSFPGRVGTLTVTVPLARLTADEQGLTLDLRPTILKRITRRLIEPPPTPGAAFWSAGWDEIEAIDVAARSVVVHLKERRGCLFGVTRKTALAPLLRQVALHELPVRQVSSTARWFFRRDAWASPRRTP